MWLWQALSPEVVARDLGRHLEYPLPHVDVGWLIPVYLLVVLVPPLLSSHLWLRRLGAGGVATAFLAVLMSVLAWPSLWCFAAAVLSMLIVAYLRSVSPSAGAPPSAPSSRPVESPPTADGP